MLCTRICANATQRHQIYIKAFVKAIDKLSYKRKSQRNFVERLVGGFKQSGADFTEAVTKTADFYEKRSKDL